MKYSQADEIVEACEKDIPSSIDIKSSEIWQHDSKGPSGPFKEFGRGHHGASGGNRSSQPKGIKGTSQHGLYVSIGRFLEIHQPSQDIHVFAPRLDQRLSSSRRVQMSISIHLVEGLLSSIALHQNILYTRTKVLKISHTAFDTVSSSMSSYGSSRYLRLQRQMDES
jgi:hypothetical protein